MNKIRVYEARKISRENFIKNSLKKAALDGKVLSYENMVLWCMQEFKVARRTAREYLNVAIFSTPEIIKDDDDLIPNNTVIIDNTLPEDNTGVEGRYGKVRFK